MFNSEQYKDVLNLGAQLINKFPNSASLYNLIGASNNALGELDAAVENYRQATSINPGYAEAYFNIGIVLARKHELEESARAYNKAITVKPDYADAYNNLGNSLRDLKRDKEAEIAYRQALHIKEDYADAHYNLGNILQSQGKLKQAIISYETALRVKEDADTYYNMANTLKEQNKLEEAINSYNKSIGLKPNFAESYNNMGVALLLQGKAQESINSLNKALLIQPDLVDAHNNMGNTLKSIGHFEKALNFYNKGLSFRHDYADIYNNIGNVLIEQNRLSQALDAFKKALNLQPDHLLAVGNLLKMPIGALGSETLDLIDNFFKNISTDTGIPNDIHFLKAGYYMHKNEASAAFNEFCKANKIQAAMVGATSDLEQQYYEYQLEKLKSWVPNIKPIQKGIINKLFILGPSRSGKSRLEFLLSKSPKVKPLYEANKLINVDPKNKGLHLTNTQTIEFDKIFFAKQDDLQRSKYEAITSTSPHSIFSAIDLIEQLDNSFFIFVNRNKYDTGSEIFTTNYNKGNNYSNSPNQIINYLNFYTQAAKVLERKVPERTLSLSFKKIINQPYDTVASIHNLVSIELDVESEQLRILDIPAESFFRNQFRLLVKNQ